MSLARGFANAGCPSIVMNQRPVDDHATSIIMKEFYLGLAAGMRKTPLYDRPS